jgi:hypothetical protein
MIDLSRLKLRFFSASNPRADARNAPVKGRSTSGIPKTFSTLNRDPAPPKFRKRR